MAYRTVTQLTCPHDAKVKMAGFKDKYECTRCQKIIQRVASSNEEDIKDNNENMIEDLDEKFDLTKGVKLTRKNRI